MNDHLVRMEYLTVPQGGSSGNRRVIITVTLTLSTGMLLLGLSIVMYVRKRKKNNSKLRVQGSLMHNSKQDQKEDVGFPLVDFDTIANATNNFSINNKLGEGGFGSVYKGRLKNGQEIAIKRSSKSSRQGHEEFENEVICVAKLQHRNLMKLLGCCIQGEEKMLIYEFMPNKSLDDFIFVLEIVSGKRNMCFTHPDHDLNLLGHAWGLYREGSLMELLDASARESCSISEVLQSIHVGLLCVQQNLEDRPTMSSVVMMLGSEVALPKPKVPGCFTEREADCSSYQKALISHNEITITTLEP